MPPARLGGWLERLARGHGGAPRGVAAAGGVLLLAPDGATARLTAPGLDLAAGTAEGGAVDVTALPATAGVPRTAAVLLLRRGGAVVAVVDVDATGSTVRASRVRTAHVQARTAAGGWSQQRFARRRAGQAAGLVRDVAAATADVWGPHAADLRGARALLVTGGDAELVAAALADLPAALRDVAGLPHQQVALPADPRRRVLDAVAGDVGAVRADVVDAPRDDRTTPAAPTSHHPPPPAPPHPPKRTAP